MTHSAIDLKIISFGKLSEMIATQELKVFDIGNTEELKSYLQDKYPRLAGMKYIIAVNKNIVRSNQPLTNNDTVAIMPPFSGG